ncbi:MAG TPA: DUF4178 domain-containing protein [Oligoflexia bacterium]|nr:DUF4178 domain-containing protein [Oligoflexia bacterium]HMP49303.1 DUF4178 domain-containing protein [Oligoflexia bacterium]
MARSTLKYAVEEIRCKNCSSPLRVRGMGRTNSMGCEYCGAVNSFDADSVKLLSEAKKIKSKLLLPLGSRGVFDGAEFEVIGYLRRCEQTDTYFWSEYLLFNPYHGFRWLAEQNGHWIFITPDPSLPSNPEYFSRHNVPRTLYVADKAFMLFGDCQAKVVEVVGECYWEVRRGDEVRMLDYIRPPDGYSVEVDNQELNCSYSEYITSKELVKAFSGTSLSLPKSEGLSPTCPNPFADGKSSAWMRAVKVIGILTVIQLLFNLTSSSRTLIDQEIKNTVSTQSATEVAAANIQRARVVAGKFIPGTPPQSGSNEPTLYVSPSFMLDKRQANLLVKANAPVSNSWVNLTIALVKKDGTVFDEKDLEVAYYFGRDSDGSWTEGSTSSTFYFDQVPKGEYHLTISAETDTRPPIPYRIKVVYDAPYWGNYSLAVVLLLLYPVYLLIRYFKFETKRSELSDIGD